MKILILKLVACALLYAIGLVGAHLFHMPDTEVELVDHAAEHLLLNAAEDELKQETDEK